MIRNIINDYFKLLIEKNQIKEEIINKIIASKTLLKEIEKKKEFKNKYHSALSYSFQNEKYKINKIEILKVNKQAKVLVNLTHSFILNNVPTKIISAERLHYIFILRRISFKWKIVDAICKEEFPTNYNCFYNQENSALETRNFKNERFTFWNNSIDNIQNVLSKFKELQIEYRTNYFDEINEDRSLLYNPFEAVKYARKHALIYNKDYRSFSDLGGDCTNYVSQCIHHGGINLTNLWKPYSNAWVRVIELYNFLINKSYGKVILNKELYKIGSIIQFLSNKKGFYSHSGIITEVLANGDYLYCCHSYDKLDFPLSEIYPLFYDKFRVIEITKRG